MNIGKFVLLTATFMLAMALTLSCSSGDDDESGGNVKPPDGGGSFNENSQIFTYSGSTYTGSGTIKIALGGRGGSNGNDTLINAGSVTDGIISLNSPLPAPTDKFLEVINAEGCNVSANDAKLSGWAGFELYDGEEYIGRLNPTYRDRTIDIEEDADYMYASKDVNINCGTRIVEDEGVNVSITIDMKLKAGWNKVYEIEIRDPSTGRVSELKRSTDNILTNELKWML